MSKVGDLLNNFLGTDPNDKDSMQTKEVLSYSVAGLGQNLICQLVASFFLFFLTDAVGLNPIWLAVMFLCARLFDAFNDPVMGTIVDRTRSKDGKMRPYLKIMPIPIAILTILLFTSFIPASNETGAFTLATIIYICWGVCYTIVDVPYWGLASSMTNDTDKRNTMLTVARMFCTIGAGIVTVFIPIIQGWVENGIIEKTLGLDIAKDALTADQLTQVTDALASAYQTMYLITAIIVACVAVPTFWVGYKYTKERFYSENAQKSSLIHNIKLLGKNKPILLLIAVGVLGCLRMIYMTSGLYYAKYNLGDSSLFSIMTILVVPGGLVATLITPYLSRKFGKKNVFLYSHLVGGLAMIGLYFIGLSSNGTSTVSIIMFYVVLLLMGVPSGFSNILQYSMIADSIDYLEDKTGERAEGICFSMQTLISKIGMAFVAFTVLIVLGVEGYADADKVNGSESIKSGIWMMTTLLTGVSTLACCIPLYFYNFNEKEQAAAIKRIEARKAAAAESAEVAE
ncbi:MAG: glycoside-pentoside-hexuronide (GPH):cation symporter [Bacillota bacterium]